MSETSTGERLSFVTRLSSIGNRATDSDKEKLQQEFLIYMGLLMSVGGIIWGGICSYFGLLLASIIPYGYTVITLLNFTYFYFSKNFGVVRFTQVLMSLLLPFLFQWSLGGFISSGAVMLWSMLALLGSLTFQDTRLSLKWLVTYLLLTIGSGIIDGDIKEYSAAISPEVNTLLFVVNFVVISTVVFGLIVYLTTKQENQNLALEETLRLLRETQDQLKDQNVELALEKEKADQARSAAEVANRAKSIFLANMSHEIRTPMNAILGYTQILDGDSELNESQRRAIGTIGSSGEHLLGLINDILDISKIEAGQETYNVIDFDLRDMVDSLGSMFEMRCRQKGLDWRMEVDFPTGYVCGDAGKIRQILINLLGNAVKFTQEGIVGLKAEAHEENNFSFLIWDTGPGIPQDKQTSIFEPFQQEDEGMRHGGTGLGLAISLRHAQMMEGRIELESTLGEGSRFTMMLPLEPGKKPSIEKDTTDWSRIDRLAAGHSVRALVVDDVEANRDVLSQVLTKIGVEVRTADNGVEALERIGVEIPDIVFADIRMPVMDGAEMLQKIFADYGREATVAVAVTASVFDHQRQHYIDLGFGAFLDKPLRTEDIYTSLVELLGVEYVFLEEKNAAPEVEIDWADISLPADIYDELALAIQRHSVTQLRQHVQILSELGDNEHGLAMRLNELAQKYDMSGIKAVLEEVKRA